MLNGFSWSNNMSRNYVFELPFRLKSKKNNRPIFKNKKTGKYFLGKSAGFTDFENEMMLVLVSQKNRQGIAKPLSGDLCVRQIRFEFKGAQRSDLDNMLTSLLDGLQDAGIIENDKQFKLIQNIWVVPDSGRDHTTVEIGPLVKPKSDQVTISQLVETLKGRR